MTTIKSSRTGERERERIIAESAHAEAGFPCLRDESANVALSRALSKCHATSKECKEGVGARGTRKKTSKCDTFHHELGGESFSFPAHESLSILSIGGI